MAESDFRGHPDRFLWSKAAEEKRIIITRDLDYPIVGLKPAPFGVILLRLPMSFKALQITNIFKASIEKIKFEELKNKVVVISPGRIRISPLP